MSTYKNSNSGQEPNQNKGFFSKILRKTSNWGMQTDDMVLRNAVATGVNQTPTNNSGGTTDNFYDIASKNAVAKLFQKKAISYLDRSYPEKMRILREYSRKQEICDAVTCVAEECIVFSEGETFCSPVNLSEEFSKEVKKKYLDNFTHIYNKFGFKDGITVYNYFRMMLIDGFLAFEIIYDDKHRDIIGTQLIDPSTLLPGLEPTTGDSIWIQYPENPEYRKVLLDSQIIYISYSSGAEFSEISYVENLIRPYNQLKLLEQTRIMFNVTNAMTHKKFVIPTAGMGRADAENQLAQLIMDYKDEVTFNDDWGTVSINGNSHIPYNKEYWFPEGESGTPTVELLAQEGHNLNENDMLTWFYNIFKRASRIPFSRFDKSNGGGNIYGDMSEMSREEQSFFYFTQRLREVFKEIIVKPWRIKMIIDFPELLEDENFLNQINVEYNGANLFHEWKYLSNLSKRAEIVGSLSSSIMDSEGKPYFAVDYLVRKIMKMDDKELQENARWKKKSGTGSAEAGMGAGSDMGGGDMGGDFGAPDLGGEPDFATEAAPPATETPTTEAPATGTETPPDADF